MSIKTHRYGALAIGAAVAATIAGCGGSDHQPSSVFIPPQSLTGGIWSTETGTGGYAFAIVTEEGDFVLVSGASSSDLDLLFFGSLVGGAGGGANVVEGGFDVMSIQDSAAEVCPGQSAAEGAITNGAINQRRSLRLDTVIGPPCTTPLPMLRFDLRYNSIYERAAQVNTPAGQYHFSGDPDGAVITINDAGGIFAQDPDTSCVISGRITPVNQNFNAYTIEYAIEACLDPASNGSAVGFATLNGRNLISLASLTTSAGTVGAVEVLERN